MKSKDSVYWFGAMVGIFATLTAQLISPISRTEAMYMAWGSGSIILIIIGRAIIKGKKK